MGLFKPKGKHASTTGSLPKNIAVEEAEEKGQEQAESPVAAESAIEATAQAPAASVEPEPLEAADTVMINPVNEPAAPIEGGQGEVFQAVGAPAPGVVPPMAPAGFEDFAAPKKKRKVGKAIGITFGVIIGVLLVAYIAGAVVFMNWFLPRTSILGNDVSMKSNAEVAELIDGMAKDYSIKVVGNGFTYEDSGADIGLSVDSAKIVDAMHSDLNAWTWPVLIFQDEHDESGALKVTYNPQSFEKKMTEAIETFNKGAVAPTDATIAYDEKSKKFKIVPEVAGTQYDAKAILAAMDEAITTFDPEVKLTSDHLVQPKVFSTDERLVNSAELATGLVSADVTLNMAGQKAMEINGDNLSQFIRVDENMGVTLDEAALDQWITDVSNGFDTVGTQRTYTRPDGKEITVSGGAYGWSTDAPGLKDQVVAAVKAGQKTTIDVPCEQTAAVYNGPGQRDWGNRYIDVDLSEQYVRMYGDDGSCIWESACISGSPDGEHNTWPGVWYITNKQAPSKLIGYLPSGEKEYETTVAYWMAFEGNGIGLHDATWQPSFGGSMYANGYGSHGCVNLPYGAAESLYSITEVGDCVIAHY